MTMMTNISVDIANMSSDSDVETPDISTASTSTTFSDLGETSILSRKQKQAAQRWSKKEKKKAKEKEKKKQQNKITKAHFCAKSIEFKVWLQECKGLKFENMDPKKQKEYFKKFVKKWNTKKLDKKFYRGVDCLWAVGTPTTQVNWAMPAGDIEVTPGSLPEGLLEEKYSRARAPQGSGLGTFGKKAGAEMLRRLRARENIEEFSTQATNAENDIQKPDQDRKHSPNSNITRGRLPDKMKTAESKLRLCTDWPAPPSPVCGTENELGVFGSIEDGMSPLPPPPNESQTKSNKQQQEMKERTVSCPAALSDHTAMEPPITRSVAVAHRSQAPKVRPRSCALDDSELQIHASVRFSNRRRPMSYAGAGSHPPLPPSKPELGAYRPQAGSQCAPNSLTRGPSLGPKPRPHVLQGKCKSHEVLQGGPPPRKELKRMAPPPPDRSVSLDELPTERSSANEQAATVICKQTHVGAPPLKVARQTPSHESSSTRRMAYNTTHHTAHQATPSASHSGSKSPQDDAYRSELSNASHAVFQTLTSTKGLKKPGEVTPVRTKPTHPGVVTHPGPQHQLEMHTPTGTITQSRKMPPRSSHYRK